MSTVPLLDLPSSSELPVCIRIECTRLTLSVFFLTVGFKLFPDCESKRTARVRRNPLTSIFFCFTGLHSSHGLQSAYRTSDSGKLGECRVIHSKKLVFAFPLSSERTQAEHGRYDTATVQSFRRRLGLMARIHPRYSRSDRSILRRESTLFDLPRTRLTRDRSVTGIVPDWRTGRYGERSSRRLLPHLSRSADSPRLLVRSYHQEAYETMESIRNRPR